jgi:hypothetical protein
MLPWFKFAVKCVVRELRQRKDPHIDHFMIPEYRMKHEKQEFKDAFKAIALTDHS